MLVKTQFLLLLKQLGGQLSLIKGKRNCKGETIGDNGALLGKTLMNRANTTWKKKNAILPLISKEMLRLTGKMPYI